MTAEGPGRRELAELVPDHALGDEDRDELLPVVHREGVPDEIRDDGAPTRPCLQRPPLVAAVHPLDLGHWSKGGLAS